MLKTLITRRGASRHAVSAAFAAMAVLGAGLAQAQGNSSPEASDAKRSIEKSDIRRGKAETGDLDGDGLPDATQRAGQADLKKLADELVNLQAPSAGDPIPGIDITKAAPADKPVPALDANPEL